MAINTNKLLNRPVGYSKRTESNKSISKKIVSDNYSTIILSKKSIKNIGVIKVKLLKIEKILKGTLALEKKNLDDKKRKDSGRRRDRQEEKLETRPNVEMKMIKMPSIPRLGIFDWIKNFVGNILLGYFAVRLIKHLPKIIPFIKLIGSASDFLIDIGGKLLNGLATFIDWGYKAYDATRGFIKGIGGEKFAQGFDKFVSAVDTTLFLTTFLASDILAEYFSSDRGGGSSKPSQRSTRITTSGGKPVGRPDIRNPLRQRPQVTMGRGGTGPKIKVPKGMRPRAGLLGLVFLIPDLIDAGMLVSQGRGKDGIRTLLSAVSGVVAGMAAYSATLAGAAALGMTGVGIPAAIGLAVAGLAASAAAGAAAYKLTDSGLKKMGLVDTNPQTGKPYAYRSGGVTRGGKRRTSVTRRIGGVKRGKYSRVIPKKPTEIEMKPGADIGGEEKIFGIFPKPKLPDIINPFKVVKDAGKNLGKTDYFGPILAITSKITLGQKPTQKDYQNVGLGINMLISKGIQENQLKGGLIPAFAGGGLVDPDVLSAVETGGDISNWVAKTFRGEIETNAQKTLRLIKENAEKKKRAKGNEPSSDDLGMGSDVQVSSDSEDFWLLATAAMFENSHPQGAADVAQVIYNRTQYSAWNAPTIRKAILNPGQFQPVRQYGGTGAWASIKNKEDAIRFSRSHGKSVEQLERVAAALLDKRMQQDARQFVGPRDSFRADAYERANNHLANETEKSRHGHTFGFEPGGAMIGQFKAGRLSAAQVNAGVVGRVDQSGLPSLPPTGTMSGQNYGDPRDGGRRHAGQDYDISGNQSFHSRIGGEVVNIGYDPGGYGNYVDIYNKQLNVTERIAEGREVLVSRGSRVKKGQAVVRGETNTGVIHYEIRRGRNTTFGFDGTIDPKKFLGARNKSSAFHGENFGVVPNGGLNLTLHPGEVFKVVDKDTVDLLGFDLTKEIIDIENQSQLIVKAPSIIEKLKVLSGYTSYEETTPEIIIVQSPTQTPDIVDERTPTFASVFISKNEDDPFESLYRG